MRRTMLRIGERQAGALETYVFDPAHVGFEEARAAMLLQQETRNGSYYLSFYPEAVNEIYWGLVEAANSADADVERLNGEARTWARQDRDALTALADRVLRSGA